MPRNYRSESRYGLCCTAHRALLWSNLRFRFRAKSGFGQLWGKTINTGQSCTAPNHILVPAEAQEALVAALAKAYDAFYPEGPATGASISRLISGRTLNRPKGMLDKTSGSIVRGGETDEASRYMAPTIVRDVRLDDSLME